MNLNYLFMGKSLAFFFLFSILTVLSVQAQKSASVRTTAVATSQIKKAKRDKGKAAWLTALYLRPVEPAAASRENWPLIPAKLLEGLPTLCIDTPSGPKTVSQLKKGDVLYRYEPATQRVNAWEVRIVQRKARQVDVLYSMANEESTSLLENRVALDN